MNLTIGNKYLIGKDPIPKTLKEFKWRDGQGVIAIMEDHRGEERPHRLHNCEVREYVGLSEHVENLPPLVEWRDDFIRATNAMILAYDRVLGELGKTESNGDKQRKPLWIAMDQNGDVYLYLDKPTKYEKTFGYLLAEDEYEQINQYFAENLCPGLTWENSPQEI